MVDLAGIVRVGVSPPDLTFASNASRLPWILAAVSAMLSLVSVNFELALTSDCTVVTSAAATAVASTAVLLVNCVARKWLSALI